MRRIVRRTHDDALPFRVLVAFVALALSFGFSATVLAGGVVQNNRRIDDIAEVRAGLCNVRADQLRRIPRDQERLDRAAEFVDEHPAGFAGIPVSLLRRDLADRVQDLADRRQLVDALAPLRCDDIQGAGTDGWSWNESD